MTCAAVNIIRARECLQMHRTLTTLTCLIALSACSPGTPNATLAGQQSRDPLPLARSTAIEETRAPSSAIVSQTLSDEDVLALKPTDLHPDFGIGDANFRADQSSALNGDKEAALRLAHMFRRGSNAVPRDERRMVLWLRHASDLNNGTASYELYQYYLGRGLDREALRFEKRALEQGFVPPPRLDPRRG